MDWCIDTTVAGSADRAEADVLAHLARHAEHPDLVDLARPLVHKVLTGPAEGPVIPYRWVSLDWEDAAARLTVRDLEGDGWPEPGPVGDGLSPLVPGVALAHEAYSQLAAGAAGGEVSMELGVVRSPEPNIDPEPATDPVAAGAADQGVGTVAAFLARGSEMSRSPEELAAWAGATVGLSAETAYRADHSIEGALTARQVGDAFVDMERRMGGEFFVVSADEHRVILGNRRCPFGKAVVGSPSICRFTSAAAGGMAARAAGEAEVTLDERLSMGDHQCRLVVDLAPSSPRSTSHHYTSPPAGWPVVEGGPQNESYTKGFLISLTLRLPRDRLSVPVVRHLTSHALDEVGVRPEEAGDVELALAEACANVLEHSGPGDVYDVSITIGPVQCEIRVTDVGHGFDYESLTGDMAHTDSESGRGIALMHALMDQVRFTSQPERGTIVHLVKNLAFDDSVPTRRLMLAAMQSDDA